MTSNKFVFFGTGGLLSSICLNALIEKGHRPELAILQKQVNSAYPHLTEQLCLVHSVNHYICASLSEEGIEDLILKEQPEFGIIASFGEVIREPLINSFPIYNLHMGILPNYRGAYTNFWKILKNDNLYGASLHKIDRKLDAGLLIKTVERDYTGVVFAGDFFRMNYEMAAEMLISAFDELSKGNPAGINIDTSQGNYYRKHTDDDMTLPSDEDVLLLYGKINRLQFYGNPVIEQLKITSAELLQHLPNDHLSSVVTRINDHSSVLSNRTGHLLLKHY